LDQFYFGLIYQIIGPNVVIADFTIRDDNGSVFLTTAELENYLLAWKARIDLLDDDQKVQLSNRVYAMLYQSMFVLRSLASFLTWSYDNVPVKQAYPDDEEPLGNTHFACALLHLAFVRSRIEIFRPERAAMYELVISAPWLEKRMEREGWCLYTTANLKYDMLIDGNAYAYYLATVRTDTADHGRCSAVACLANDIPAVDETTEATLGHRVELRHTNAGCDCWIIEPPLTEINAILRKGKTPILRIGTDDGYKLNLLVREADPGTRTGNYVALSHVWVDGLGSPYSNAIAQCQLTRIADRLGKLEATEACGELCIWTDTLCVPVDPQHSQLRQLAIMNMHKVYRDAYAVIVMDADLLRLQGRPPLHELGIRLYLTAWSSRLWTYQEGALNDRLLVMTADGFLDVDEYSSNRNASVPPRSKVQDFLETYALRTIATIRGPRNLNTNPLHRLQSPVPHQDNHESFNRVAQLLFNAIQRRSSSRADDDVIVIATYLDLPLSSILARSGDERMIALLQAMPSIPEGILFAKGERFKRIGFRWAPRVLTKAKGGNTFIPGILRPKQSPADESPELQPLMKLDSRYGGLWAFSAAIKVNRVLIFEPEGKRDGPIMVFQLFGSIHWFDATLSDSGPQYETEIATLRKATQQMSTRTEQSMILLLSGFTLNPKQMIRAALVDITGEVADAEHKGSLVVKYVLPGEVQPADSMGPYILESVKGAMGASGQNAEDYDAEWLEPRYWLVD
jgi:hypothetical protein